MKKLLLLLVLFSFSFSTYSSDGASKYYCEEAYRDKLQRMEDNRTARNIGKYTSQGILFVGGLISGYILAESVGLIVIGTMTGSGLKEIPNLFDREEGLKYATKFLDIAHASREELKSAAYEKFILDKLDKLNNQGEAAITTEESLKQAYPYDEFEFYTMVDSVLERINKKRSRKKLKEYSYEEFQTELFKITQTNEFCSSKRLDNYNKIVRKLRRMMAKKS